jgi:hypothetical protein
MTPIGVPAADATWATSSGELLDNLDRQHAAGGRGGAPGMESLPEAQAVRCLGD